MPAASFAYPQFFYRRNQDNSIDAICSWCFLTAATADNEATLHELEAVHQCPQDVPMFSSRSKISLQDSC